MRRVFLTTVCRERGLYNYFRENAPRNFRWRLQMPRRISFGLRFLKQNIPELGILEFPTRAEFSKTLRRGCGVVSFSFFLNESQRILRMAEEPHRSGVRQL